MDETAEYFAHKDLHNFWRSWNNGFNKHAVHTDNVCIDESTQPKDKLLPHLETIMPESLLIPLVKNLKFRNTMSNV